MFEGQPKIGRRAAITSAAAAVLHEATPASAKKSRMRLEGEVTFQEEIFPEPGNTFIAAIIQVNEAGEHADGSQSYKLVVNDGADIIAFNDGEIIIIDNRPKKPYPKLPTTTV